MILQTARLTLRELTACDYRALCRIVQDAEVMYAYEHAFSDDEARDWLDKQRWRYTHEGFGLWACCLKTSGEMIGQCGLTMQDTPYGRVVEVGYLFEKAYWHRGFATEAAIVCKEYAFSVLGIDEVFSIIRENNLASQAVAKRNGMSVRGRFVKHYMGIEMPHLIFSARR